ncbi:hypothetical protein JOB18_003022 [Solea senegalensis]|uniref:Uncharacterized protein n=1 Tax=Solea senegalensis TaxID=28829 RepID=A0AAV6SP54_SOLSE|nr:hypothetical protein JOB18_003022 [Solea senegalensis]
MGQGPDLWEGYGPLVLTRLWPVRVEMLRASTSQEVTGVHGGDFDEGREEDTQPCGETPSSSSPVGVDFEIFPFSPSFEKHMLCQNDPK